MVLDRVFECGGAEKGYPEHLLEHCLAHTERNAVVAAYKRTDLLEERRDIMSAWAEFVMTEPTEAILRY